MHRIFAVSIFLPLSALAQEPPATVQLFCISDEASAEANEINRPLDALKAVNAVLDKGGMLIITGATGQFFDGWVGGPDFTVRANLNEVVVLDRGLMMEGGPGCNAWIEGSGNQPQCDWRPVALPGVDLNGEPRETAYMVWETLILTGDEIMLVRVLSGGREQTTQFYACDDPKELLRYLRPGE